MTLADKPEDLKETDGPLYRAHASAIAAAIRQGQLERGLVLLEGRLASLLATSRATVRKALQLLSDEGTIQRFEGRGFIVAGVDDRPSPIRRKIQADDLAANASANPMPAADAIIADVEAALTTAIAFGHYRIDEQVLASVFSVSRPVAREVLWRLREAGLVEKQHHYSWLAGPVTARAVAEDRELRMLLEPHALKLSAPHIAKTELHAMRERIDAARRTGGRVARQTVEEVEQDLHITCTRHYRNDRVQRVMRTGRLPIVVDALFADLIGIYPDDPAFGEHAGVLDLLLSQEFDKAAESHCLHLRRESTRTLDRLKVLSVLPEPDVAPYLQRIV